MEKTIIISLFLLLFSPYSVKAKQQKENIWNGHEYVDLGLPSGTLWATCNVGADKPEAFGDYFQWGDTKAYILDSLTFILNDGPHTYYLERDQRKLLEELPPSKRFGRLHDFTSAYKFINGKNITKNGMVIQQLTKYCSDSFYGIVDYKKELDLEDDAAYIHWGTKWRIPSKEQFNELFNNKYTRCLLQTHKGVWGCLITSKIKGYTGKSIFLPAAGIINSTINKIGQEGCYWTCECGTNDIANSIIFRKTHSHTDSILFKGKDIIGRPCAFSKRYALPIRPVWQK